MIVFETTRADLKDVLIVNIAAGKHVDRSNVIVGHACPGSLVYTSSLTFGSGYFKVKLRLLE